MVATGWSEGGAPTLFWQGRPVRDATCRLFPRPDVSPAARGFRLAAALDAPYPDPKECALRFADRTVTPVEAAAIAEAVDPRTTVYPTLIPRFIAAMKRPARLLEIGSRERSGSSFRKIFPAFVEHVGLDVKAGPGVDVVGDAHHLSRHVEGPFGFVFSISVFEHLLMPWKVALEMNEVMETGGLAYIQSHAAWPLHEEPWDFFRFSTEAWRSLFNAHTGFELLDAGYSLAGAVLPRHAAGGTVFGLEASPAYLISACLARKTGPARVRWDGEASEVFDLAYSHG